MIHWLSNKVIEAGGRERERERASERARPHHISSSILLHRRRSSPGCWMNLFLIRHNSPTQTQQWHDTHSFPDEHLMHCLAAPREKPSPWTYYLEINHHGLPCYHPCRRCLCGICILSNTKLIENMNQRLKRHKNLIELFFYVLNYIIFLGFIFLKAFAHWLIESFIFPHLSPENAN